MYEDYTSDEELEPSVQQQQSSGSGNVLAYAQILQGQIDEMKKQDWRTRKLYHKLS